MTTPTPPLGCGPEGSVSKYADLLNDLEDMAGSYAYAVRREVLRNAGRTIMQLERDLAAAQAELASVREHAEDMASWLQHGRSDVHRKDVLMAYRAAHPKDAP